MNEKLKILKDEENFYNLLAKKEFKYFFRAAWEILEPKRPLLKNWHQDLICEYLEAVYKSQIKKLIINIPPRYTKSNLVSVCFPAWVWINKPTHRFICTSYSQSLSTKHAIDRRMVIESDWYARSFGQEFKILSDQNQKTEFSNDKRGTMIATSMSGSATGKGCDILIVDDPHNPKGVMSEVKRNGVIEAFDRVFSTRLDDKDKGAIIVVMQRLHEKDLCGHLLDQGEWEHLKIQGLAHEQKTFVFPISKKEKTVQVNEPLHEKRENLTQLNSQKKLLGSYGFAGQYQQEPSPADGGIFKRQWLHNFWNVLPGRFDFKLISIDMSFKEADTSDFVVIQAWGKVGAEKYLLDQVRLRADFITSTKTFEAFCRKHHDIGLKLVEEKANGAALISALKKKLSGLVPVNPKDSKESRAQAVSPEFESGSVFIPDPSKASWVHDYIEEMCVFPRGRNDDQVDTTTQALLRLSKSSGNFVDSEGKTSKSLVASTMGDGQW